MYKFGDLRLGVMWQESDFLSAGVKEDGYAANVSYKLDKFLLKAQYQEFLDADAISLGVDYKLGKKTKVFAFYTDREGQSPDFEEDAPEFKFAKEGEYFAIGMEQKF